eukprot:jgi/Mesvir1/27650/Mv07378-RA.1
MPQTTVQCANGGCGKPGTQACSRCHAVYYCSRECQRASYGMHKRLCHSFSRHNESAGLWATLDEASARELVANAARCLDDERVTPAGRDSGAILAFCTLGVSAQRPDNERLLGKVGACELLVRALDATLAGRLAVPLCHLCAGIMSLTNTSVKNKRRFGDGGVIPRLARVLAVASREHDWQLMEKACQSVYTLALTDHFCHCNKYGEAGMLEAIGRCVVVAAGATPLADACYAACDALTALHYAVKACADPGCQNKRRLGAVPGVHAALDNVLEHAVTLGDRKQLRSVCGAIYGVTDCAVYSNYKQPHGMATPRVAPIAPRAWPSAGRLDSWSTSSPRVLPSALFCEPPTGRTLERAIRLTCTG